MFCSTAVEQRISSLRTQLHSFKKQLKVNVTNIIAWSWCFCNAHWFASLTSSFLLIYLCFVFYLHVATSSLFTLRDTSSLIAMFAYRTLNPKNVSSAIIAWKNMTESIFSNANSSCISVKIISCFDVKNRPFSTCIYKKYAYSWTVDKKY